MSGKMKWLLMKWLVIVEMVKMGLAANTDFAIRFSPRPLFGQLLSASAVSMYSIPASVGYITVTNSKNFSTNLGYNTCDGQCYVHVGCSSCSCGDCLCTNPVQAMYQCTILETNPPQAINKITFDASVTTTSDNTNSQNICQMKVNSALTTGDYIAGSNAVFVNVQITLSNLNNQQTPCNNINNVVTGWYNFTVTPVTTTTSTSTTTRTTTRTTTTTTNNPPAPAPAPVTTTTSTSTSTTTSTLSASTTYTTAAFVSTPAGVAIIVACSVVGAVLLVVALYFIAKACGACPTTSPGELPAGKSIGSDISAVPEAKATGPSQPAYTYGRAQANQGFSNNMYSNSTPAQVNNASAINNSSATYSKQVYPSGTPNPSFGNTFTPVS